MQLTLIIIASFLAVLQQKKNIDEMQTFYKATHSQHEAISSALSDMVIGHQGLSSACLQCSPWSVFSATEASNYILIAH